MVDKKMVTFTAVMDFELRLQYVFPWMITHPSFRKDSFLTT